MKRVIFVTIIVVLLMMSVGDIARAQNVPLIIDPDKVDEYLAERKDTINVYDVVEQMPCFPGGQGRMLEFIEEKMQYPKKCAEKGVYGRVIVAFVVERSGKLSNVTVVKSVHPVLDKEAIRIVKLMPRWIPGRQNGITVRVKCYIPIIFRLK
jgi:protein TonB